MTPRQYREALDKLGLSQGAAAEWTGKKLRTIHGYCNGSRIPQDHAMLIRLVLRLKLKPEDVK